MGRMAFAALLQVGCGRLLFAPVDDTTRDGAADAFVCVNLVGHDEDADGFDDACDVCPQRADDQRDSDGDRVGDACDRSTSAQTLTLFDPFTGARPEWTNQSGMFLGGDSLRFTNGGGADLVTPPGTDTLELVGVLVSSTLEHQIAVGICESPIKCYYCATTAARCSCCS